MRPGASGLPSWASFPPPLKEGRCYDLATGLSPGLNCPRKAFSVVLGTQTARNECGLWNWAFILSCHWSLNASSKRRSQHWGLGLTQTWKSLVLGELRVYIQDFTIKTQDLEQETLPLCAWASACGRTEWMGGNLPMQCVPEPGRWLELNYGQKERMISHSPGKHGKVIISFY